MEPHLSATDPLGPDEVAVWRLDLGASPPSHELEALLSPAERAEVARYRSAEDRRQHAAGRALLRTALSRHAAVAPADWRITRDPHGKPRIGGPPQAPALRFSLAHTGSLALCAVTLEREVGVDVEDLRREVDVLALARRFFAPDEARALEEQAGEARRAAFFARWTLKEAYGKARGLGLSLGLARTSFELPQGAPPRARFAPELEDDPRAWCFQLERLEPGHLMALAVEARAGPRPRCVVRGLQLAP